MLTWRHWVEYVLAEHYNRVMTIALAYAMTERARAAVTQHPRLELDWKMALTMRAVELIWRRCCYRAR